MRDRRSLGSGHWGLFVSCILGFEIFLPSTLAQPQDADDLAQPARGNPAALTGRDAAQGVYVRDSAVAVEKFALAQRLERLKEWDKSADVYMEILEKYADRVVPSQVDKDNRIYQYTSVASAVQERLAKWPRAGLDVYRSRYEDDAEGVLQLAGDDPAKLHRIVSLYFVTQSSTKAALRLMDLNLESADFPAAAWLGERMLAWHPALDDQRPRFLYRTALACHLAGEDAQAKAKLDELKERHPDSCGTVRGKDVNLAESLATEIGYPSPALRAAPSDSWPMAFGSPDRARVPAATAAFGARLFSVEMIKSMVRVRGGPRVEIERQNQLDRGAGQMTGVLPVVDRGELFFQDNSRIYAVSLESGTALPGWADTYDGDRGGRYALSAWSTPRGQQCTLTVSDDAVYAVMAQPDVAAMTMTGTMTPRGETRLVCLDRRTGRERWVASARSLPQDAAAARNLDFSGSPLVAADTVFVMGRGGKGMQFEDAYVLAFEAQSGRFKWLCYLASANTGLFEFGDFSGMMGQRVSHLAYWGGRLYAMTNLGALAAVDSYDGTIVWLNLYPRDVPEPNRLMGVQPWNQRRAGRGGTSPNKPWTSNPVMVTAGKVFALPSDGLHVLAYDAATGVETLRIPLSQFEDAQTLLGIVDEKLLLASDRTVFCINWPAYEEARGVNGNLVWRSLSFSKAQYPDDAIRGRGFITQDAVVIPTAWALHRISLRSGRHEASYPMAGAEWAEGEAAGNVLVMQDRLIVATPERVNVYTDLRLAMSKLDAEVAAAPDQPEPRLRYAEIMMVAGKWDVSIAKLDEAMQLIGAAGTGAAPARDRLFADALAFAQRVARDGNDAAFATASELFDRAALAAGTPSQNVNYRLTRARVMKSKLAPDAELKLYQEILADAAMRDVPVSAGDGANTRPAGGVAERAITDLLARNGRAIYDPFETAAAEKLEAAQAEKDPKRFLAIAQEFPNAKLAPQALLDAAEAYETRNDPRLAAQVLRQLLFRYPDAPDQSRTIESLARNYLALPNRVDVAIARLAQGARKPGARLTRPLKLPDGKVLQNVSFDEAVRALRKVSERSAAGLLPDMRLPVMSANGPRGSAQLRSFLPEAPESVVASVSALVPPLKGFARNDRVVAFLPDRGLCVFAVGQNEPLFASDAFTQPVKGVAWNGQNLVAWNETELAVLQAVDGQTVWKTTLQSLPAVEVVPAPSGAVEPNDADDAIDEKDPRADAMQLPDQQRQLRQQQELRAALLRQRRIGRGGVPQPAAIPAAAVAGPEQIIQLRPLSDRIIFCTSTGRLVALDSSDGRILWQSRPAEGGPTHFLASDDFVVLRLEDGSRVQLLVLDALSGQFLSRRVFTNDNGAGIVPINLALAPDGTLVWIMPDRICGKDLFEPGDRLRFDETGRRDGNPSLFAGASATDHLQIADGRIFVVSDNGIYVRVYALDSGKPLQSESNDIKFTSGAKPGTWGAILRPVGRMLYVVGAKELYSYDLENLSYNQDTPLESLRPRDVVVTRSHVVILSEPAGPVQRPRRAGTTTLQLQAVSRALDDKGRESGLLDQKFTLSDPATIIAWQPVEGGLYYLGGDQRLHFLRGARDGP